jgi:ribosome maturation factor RimP
VGRCPLFVFLGAIVDLERVRAAADRVARTHGLEIFDVIYRREAVGWVLRVMIDRRGAADTQARPGQPVDAVSVDDCRVVSQDLGALLDVEDPVERAYTLEVSSPGLDRRLRGADDYERFRGRLAQVVTTEAVEGQTHFRGRLQGLDGDRVVLLEGRREHRVPVSLISRARLEVEF